AQLDAALADGDGVQMEEDVGEHHDDAVAAIARRRMAEDALPDLRVADEITDGHRKFLDEDIRFRIVPLSQLLLELAGLVDDDLAVVGLADGVAFERPGCWSLEVDAGDAEAGAVAGALELLVPFEPVRRAAQV